MARILVAGGTGAIGSAIVTALHTITDHHVRVLSRKTAPPTMLARMEWAQGDTASGDGLAGALRDVDIVINCTGDAQNVEGTDVAGVRQLAGAAAHARVAHFVHVSIVGIDRIPFAYFQHKVTAERAVAESGVPWSVQRVTQVHGLLDWLLQSATPGPEGCVLPLAGAALFQPIDPRDVAASLVPRALAAPAGLLPDVGGPDVLCVDEIAATYFRLRGLTPGPFIDPTGSAIFPPAAVEAFRQGLNTVPAHRHGRITWADFVAARYGSAPAAAPSL